MNAGIKHQYLKVSQIGSNDLICLFTYILSFIDRKCKNECQEMLTLWNSLDSDDTSSDNIENIDNVKANIMRIINIAKSGNGLKNLRTKSEILTVYICL